MERDLGRDVARQRVVRGGLVRDDVEPLARLRPRRLDLRGVADERDRRGLAGGRRLPRHRQRLLRGVREPVHVADLVAALRAVLVHLDRDADALVHRHRQRLGAAHPAEARGEHHPSAQRPAEVLARELRERLVRALEDPLGADVDPGPRGHLAVHHQALLLELPEDVPGGPLAHEVRVGDQDPRRPLVGAEDRDRLARLDEERLVVGEAPQLADDRVERLPAAGRPAGPAVDDEVVGVLRDLRVEVVHEHPQDGLLLPAAGGERGAARGADGARAGGRGAGCLGAHGRESTSHAGGATGGFARAADPP